MSTPCSNRKALCSNEHRAFFGAKRRQKPAPSSEGAENALRLTRCSAYRLSPLLAGCPHPSRCSAKAPHRATFPKGKAMAAPPQATDFPQRKKCSIRFSVNAIIGRRYNPSVFSACKTSRKASSPYTGEPRMRSVYRSAKWGAEAATAASHRIAKVRTAVKPALAGCPHPSRCRTAAFLGSPVSQSGFGKRSLKILCGGTPL